MPYCAKCLIEYVDGTTQCEDCGATLLPGSPPASPPRLEIPHEKDVRLVPARVFTGGSARMDSELARNILQTQGIPSTIAGEGLSDPLPVTEVHLLVREEDAARAERVLQEYLDTEVPAAPEDADPADAG
jgi:hypothetical protein